MPLQDTDPTPSFGGFGLTEGSIRGEEDALHVNAICVADYWATTTRSMVWLVLDHLDGGGTSVENIRAYWTGMPIPDDYGGAFSAVCDYEDGQWFLVVVNGLNGTYREAAGE